MLFSCSRPLQENNFAVGGCTDSVEDRVSLRTSNILILFECMSSDTLVALRADLMERTDDMGATKYRDERGADILHMIAYENAIAPFAEFTYGVFECIKEIPLLRVLTDEDYNNLPNYWHA